VDAPPKPRSSARRALRYAAVGGVIGALVVLGSWIVAASTGGTRWAFVDFTWILFGGATGAVLGPLLALARDDGREGGTGGAGVTEHGRADTSTEGAQAQDLGRSDPPL
jgi:formate hydrogenlyase subunit 3/multisubunit Na+/H+ antiporter MnhD subunit